MNLNLFIISMLPILHWEWQKIYFFTILSAISVIPVCFALKFYCVPSHVMGLGSDLYIAIFYASFSCITKNFMDLDRI